jgi:hypothetical protein
MQRDVFIFYFDKLCDWYVKKPSPEVIDVFLAVLKWLSDNEWKKAFEWAISTQQFMPTPQMLLESVRGEIGSDIWKQLLWASTELDKIRYENNYLQLRKAIYEQLPEQAKQFVEDEGLILPDLINKTEYQLESLKKRALKKLNSQVNTTKLLPINNNGNIKRLPQS